MLSIDDEVCYCALGVLSTGRNRNRRVYRCTKKELFHDSHVRLSRDADTGMERICLQGDEATFKRLANSTRLTVC